MSLKSSPSIRTLPDQGVNIPQISLAMVDLPLPETPTSATRLPGGIDKVKSSIRGGPMELYPKVTLSSSTKPRGAGAGADMSGSRSLTPRYVRSSGE